MLSVEVMSIRPGIRPSMRRSIRVSTRGCMMGGA
jgi:hypothetical protein